jgi:hypothetical protein
MSIEAYQGAHQEGVPCRAPQLSQVKEGQGGKEGGTKIPPSVPSFLCRHLSAPVRFSRVVT